MIQDVNKAMVIFLKKKKINVYLNNMKRFLLMFAFMLSMIAASAQVYTYRSYAYAQKNAGYSWSNFVSSDLKITINLDTDVIRIYNKLNSCFLVQTSREYYNNQDE